MIDDALLGFGWYGAEVAGDCQWYWSRDVFELRTVGLDLIVLSFFTHYEDVIGKAQQLVVVCNGKLRSRHALSSGAQTLAIPCADADEVYLFVDVFRPSEHDAGSTDGRSLGIGLTGITCEPAHGKNRATQEVARREVPPNAPPIMMQIEVSTACHLACVMCSRSARSGGLAEHMTDHVWQSIATLIPAVDQVNILGTGEPWTHPKFLDWLDVIDACGAGIYITTSGDLINEARARRLGGLKNLRVVTFSIDSPDPDIYSAIRGQPLARALDGMRRTLEYVSDPDVARVHAVVMRNNLYSLSGFPALLNEIGIRCLDIRGVNNTKHATRDLVPEYTARERDSLLATRHAAELLGITVSMLPALPRELIYARQGDHEDEMPQADQESPGDAGAPTPHDGWRAGVQEARPHAWPALRAKLAGLVRRGGTRFFHRDEPLPEGMRRYLDHKIAHARTATTKICMDPWEKFFVTRRGDVYPCEAYHLQGAVGSLANETAEEVWYGARLRQFRKELLEGSQVACRNCERRPTGAHPFNRYAAEIVSVDIRVGDASLITVRNVGDDAWGGDVQVVLGTARPRDRDSRLLHASWISRNRLCRATEDTVSPGGTATFRFLTTSPAERRGMETLQLVVEGRCWLPNTEITVCLAGELAAADA